MADDGDVSLLVIVVDVNPIWWGQQILKESQFTLSKCMDAVMVMGNSHLAMSRKHRLAIIASHSQESRFLYPGKQWKMGNFAESGDIGSTESNCSGSKDGKYELLAIGNDIITEEIKDLMSKTEVRAQLTETLLAGSLAKALCYIHKVNKELEVGQELNSRILVIKAAEDSASQYMNFMNVIFAAQKQNILIDACVLDSESGLLQQSHLHYMRDCFQNCSATCIENQEEEAETLNTQLFDELTPMNKDHSVRLSPLEFLHFYLLQVFGGISAIILIHNIPSITSVIQQQEDFIL